MTDRRRTARLRGLLADVTPLRTSADFRRLWISSLASTIGSQMTTFAVALQVYLITGSSIAVGGVGLAVALPGLTTALLGGSVIDAVDRRRLVLLMSSLALLVSVSLAIQAFAEAREVWLLYGLVAVQSAIGSVNGPARRTFMPRLLPTEQIPAGAALTMLAMHTSTVTGPALAGLVTAAGGLKFCYLVDAVSYLAALYGVFRLPEMRPEGGGTRPGLSSTLEGLRFVARTRVVAGALLADVNATVLAMPLALFPAINDERFGGSASTLGLLTSALGIGGVLGSALSGPVGRVRRPGLALLVAGAAWAVALAGFGLADGFVLTFGALVVAGVADVVAVVLRTTIVQVATPDAYRGRVNASEFAVGALCPQLGNFRAGTVASLTSPSVSAVSGGITAAIGAGVLFAVFPVLRRYRSPVTVRDSAVADPA